MYGVGGGSGKDQADVSARRCTSEIKCSLPQGMVQTRVNADWSCVEQINGDELSRAILAHGWHCAWLAGGFSHIGLGESDTTFSSYLERGLAVFFS
jgi:hypothetical protein